MLVLTRKAGQIITIGEDIRIKIVDIGNGIVKLGIEAPREMPIYREELYEKLKQLNKESVSTEIDKLKDFFGLKDKDAPSIEGRGSSARDKADNQDE